MSDPDKMIRILITALFSAGRNAVSGCGEKWPEMCKMAFYDSCLVFARGMPPLPPSPPPPLLWEVEAKTCCIHVWRIFLSTQLFWYEKEIYLFKDPEQCCGSGSKLNLCGSVFWICIRIHTVTVKIATKKPWLADNNSSSSELVYTVPTAVF